MTYRGGGRRLFSTVYEENLAPFSEMKYIVEPEAQDQPDEGVVHQFLQGTQSE